MKGKDTVIQQLQKILRSELASRDQYFIHSRMYQNWGLHKLYERTHHEMEEETQHATWLIERILFLEATPDLSSPDVIKIGQNVPEVLRNDLELEYKVMAELKEAISVCEKEQDYETREILLKILADTEEDHIYWLEQQLGLIEKIGLANYLQSQM
ncbi:MAG: bacterioferritin [Geminocystis sp.]|nr:bacterioferritin [Geminocystis sp.]HIK37056.1 bacterioferritin [Geminocystis sp. M7585_C2015_104]MCS7148952.1 bacterioferritin [Geminocystis sp.]MCX8077542.1 bacterioferritin [Geminocystis sp.]MDW8117201.1 bacterioferritin [Geminocystis sp.]